MKDSTGKEVAGIRRRFVLGSALSVLGGMHLTACGGGGGSAMASTPSSTPNTTPADGTPTDGGTPVSVDNRLRVSLSTGSETNYPLQFGRPFAVGEILDTPSVFLDGVIVASQADVKSRHADGSVKFAVISVVLPTLGTTERVLSFGNQPKPAAAPLPLADMLDKFDFDALIRVTFGQADSTPLQVSARSMLAALTDAGLAAETAAGGVQSRYWTQGPLCTTVLLCDHKSKAYDLGSNATRAIRPMFHVQFWPTIGKYHVRHIVEVADVTRLKDELTTNVSFLTGKDSPVVRLTQSSVNLYAGTWQSRAFWGGRELPRANLKHGVAYLAKTRAMPNYDSSIVIHSGSLSSYASDWATRPQGLGARGYWQIAMSSVGGRPDLGLMPKWDTVSMYSGAASMQAICERHAELAGSWAFFFREGDSAKTIYGTTSGQGRILSKLSRPTVFLHDNNAYWAQAAVADRFKVDGTLNTSRDGWAHDAAHTPGMFWWMYLSTGQAFWQEKLLQLAAWSLFVVNPGLAFNSVGNGSSNKAMIINGVQVRGWGWQFRNRARAWWAALDGSPERALLEQSLTEAVAQRCGLYGIASSLDSHPVRASWNTNYKTWYSAGPTYPRPNALAYWEGYGGYTRDQFISSVGEPPDDWGGGATAPWMQNFITLSVNHAVELGVSVAQPLANWVATQAITIAKSAHPRHIADYVFPQNKKDGTYYQTLDDLYDGFPFLAEGTTPASMPPESTGGFPGGGAPGTYQVTVEGYGAIAVAAIASANGHPDQAAAWSVVGPWSRNTYYFNHDPRYAIVPRT
ncbi:MAG TPA: hypothetical protein VK195_08480 [Burkholderiaceae bacterium]|nr:hypothetical protein [Burkholderiaceae bacterium]